MASWDLVIWVNENSCGAVPTSWKVVDGVYLWPKNVKASKLKRLIAECQEPSVEIIYDELEATWKKTITNDYSKVLKKLALLEVQSNLESGAEETTKHSEGLQNADLNAIIGLLTKQSFDLSEIKKTLHNIEGRLELLEATATSNVCSNVTSMLNKKVTNFQIPIVNLEQFSLINEELQDPIQRSTLAVELRLAGGNTPRQMVTAMLRKLLIKDVALQFSGKGKKGKLDFSSSNLYIVLLEAIRLRYGELSDTGICQMIGVALATSRDWDGGAKDRLAKGSAEKDSM